MENITYSDDEDEENWQDTNYADEFGALSQEQTPVAAPNTAKIPSSTLQSTKPDKADQPIVSRMLLNDNKAGMDGLDKERINAVILEASKGSKFYENERKKEEQVKQRIIEQKIKMEKITSLQLQHGLQEADRVLQELEDSRDLSRTIVHVDMDAFYAAVEMRDDPSLKTKPMAVGGMSMLSTSNYEARKYGVRAAMPGFIARKLCPDLVIVSTNFEKYTAVSKDVREIFAKYDPHYCPMSLDEAYLDITEHLESREMSGEKDRTFIKTSQCDCGKDSVRTPALSIEHSTLPSDQNHSLKTVTGSQSENFSKSETCLKCGKQLQQFVTFGKLAWDAVEEMRYRIEDKTRLTASAGIAPNMMLAKVCSDKNKPNGQYMIRPTKEDVMEFVKDLPLRKVSGIGKVTSQMLTALGVVTCSDLYEKRALVMHLYSPISFNYFLRICSGIGSTTVERDGERKSMSVERTFSEISQPSELSMKCHELAVALSEDLNAEGLVGKTVTLKLKTVEFEVKTRAQALINYTSDVETIYGVSQELLKAEIQACSPLPLRLRLMGIRMSSFLRQSQLNECKQSTITAMLKRMKTKQTSQNIADYISADIKTGTKESNLEKSLTIDQKLTQREEALTKNTDVLSINKCTCIDVDGSSESSTAIIKNEEKFIVSSGPACLLSIDSKTEETRDTSTDDTSLVESSSLSSQSVNTTLENTSYICPICNSEFVAKDLESFNAHVDLCLNRGTIREMLREQIQKDLSCRKRPAAEPSNPGNRKRRKSQLNNKKIDQFFRDK